MLSRGGKNPIKGNTNRNPPMHYRGIASTSNCGVMGSNSYSDRRSRSDRYRIPDVSYRNRLPGKPTALAVGS